MMKRVAGTLLLTLGGAGVAVYAVPPRIDACSLLQQQEIERAIGQPVETGARRDAGMESNGAWSSSCIWMVPAARAATPDAGKPSGGRSFVILNAMQWPLGSGRAHEFLDSFREAAASGVLPRAPEPRHFGDEALWWGDGLAVRKGDVSFGLSVHVPHAAAEAPGAAEARLAPAVLERLEGRRVQPRISNSERS